MSGIEELEAVELKFQLLLIGCWWCLGLDRFFQRVGFAVQWLVD